jgi:hypothetical protein
MSAPLKAIALSPHTDLLNVYMQIANKIGLQQQQQKFWGLRSKLEPSVGDFYLPLRTLQHQVG